MKRAQFKVRKEEGGTELQEFLAMRLGVSRNKAKGLLDERNVFVNDRRVWMARHRLKNGDAIEIVSSGATARARDLAVLYQDESLVIVDKPAGVLSNGPDSVEERLRTQMNAASLTAVHRLDRDTSGCLILARSPDAAERLIQLFHTRDITKLYHVLVVGRVPLDVEGVSKPIDNLPAVTHLKVLDSNAHATHLLAKLETGRTHQIRRHMEFLGYPVLGDRSYGTATPMPQEFRRVPRQMLHASGLRFTHPLTGKKIRVDPPLPSDFRACLRMLRLT